MLINHFHLVMETPEANLSIAMCQLNGVYTQAFNRRHDQVGHVLQGRIKAIVMERNSYLLELSRGCATGAAGPRSDDRVSHTEAGACVLGGLACTSWFK